MTIEEARGRIRGSVVPLVTPFSESGEIDDVAFGRLVDWQIDEGSHGISVTGTTGEPSALSLDERERMISLAVQRTAGRVPVVVGTGTNNHRETIRLTKYAEKEGADAALVIVPYYNKPSQEGLFQHLRSVAESVAMPIIIYNIPGRTAVNLEVPTLVRLVEACSNVIGVKEANVNLQQVSDELLALGPDFLVFSGIEALCFPMLALGGAGHVSATANVAPRLVARLYDLCREGRWEEARSLHYRLLPLNEALFLETNPGPVKWAMGQLGKITPTLRLPLVPPTPPHQEAIRDAMRGLGSLEVRA